MAARAIWSGVIKIAEVICPVKMYTAATTSERIALHMVNRKTGNRLHRVYVDEKTDKPVASEDQVKGYETHDGSYVVLEPDVPGDSASRAAASLAGVKVRIGQPVCP